MGESISPKARNKTRVSTGSVLTQSNTGNLRWSKKAREANEGIQIRKEKGKASLVADDRTPCKGHLKDYWETPRTDGHFSKVARYKIDTEKSGHCAGETRVSIPLTTAGKSSEIALTSDIGDFHRVSFKTRKKEIEKDGKAPYTHESVG